MTATSPSVDSRAPSLERDAIGLPEVLFQSITHMAPAVATALSIGAATSFAGGITPLAVLFAMIAVLFTAFSMAELARHLPSAGGMFTYVRRGLGSFFGWLVAWGFALAEPLIMPLLLGGFGFYGAIFLSAYLGIDIANAWVGLAVLCGLLVWFLIYRGIALSTRTGLVLGVIEIAIFLLISALLIVNADQNTLGVFVPGEDGVRPAFQGMIFCLLAFIGFEAAAPLGEETREPRRTIPRAVIWSAILVGLFYVFNYYAATVFFGPDRMTEFYTFNEGDPWGFMAEQVLPGIGGLLVVFAILNSTVANANAGATAATRSLFALGRVSLLPRWFAAVHPETRAPVNAVHFQAITALIIAVVLGFVLADDPYPFGLNVYVFLGTMLGLLFAGIYIAVNLACIGFFWRERRDEFNVIKHLVVPIIGVVAMIPAALAVIGGLTIPILDVELPPYDNYLRYTAPIVGAWVLIGIAVWFVLRLRSPEALDRMGDVYGGEAPSPTDDVV
ncbi:MAG TPA: APC family permease [candidate division Zixibacteria bacterium]|nr:APC family permease [candidate division Zixibacteria bacterium]